MALFFYAGHAVQVAGQNYLAPVDTTLEKESDLDFETISLEFVQRQMEREAQTLLIFLDSCRNNPLTRRLTRLSRSQGNSQGLARLETSSEGTFITFSTQPGNVALDGTGRNSPFTEALLKNIDRPGVEISALMTDVRRDVYKSTEQQQLPWTNSSLLGQFYFNPAAAEAGTAQSPEEKAREERLERLEAEADRWEKARDGGKAELERFLAEFPSGFYAELATSLLKEKEAAKDPEKPAEPAEKNIEIAKLEPPEPAKVEEPEIAALDSEAVRSLQGELERVGCSPGRPDGIWGKASRSALTNYARHAGTTLASLEPDKALLDELKGRSERVCPAEAPKSVSVSRPVQDSAPARRSPPVQRKSSGNCFTFNGKQICD